MTSNCILFLEQHWRGCGNLEEIDLNVLLLFLFFRPMNQRNNGQIIIDTILSKQEETLLPQPLAGANTSSSQNGEITASCPQTHSDCFYRREI